MAAEVGVLSEGVEKHFLACQGSEAEEVSKALWMQMKQDRGLMPQLIPLKIMTSDLEPNTDHQTLCSPFFGEPSTGFTG